MFICTSLGHHCIALHYIFLPPQYKLKSFNYKTAFTVNIILLKQTIERYIVSNNIYLHLCK